MPIDPIHLMGSGGHAKVVLDAILLGGVDRDRIRVLDGDDARAGSSLLGFTILRFLDQAFVPGGLFHVAIGDGETRRRLYMQLLASGGAARTVRHPLAHVSLSAEIGGGSFLAAGANLGPEASIGRGAIINHGAVVDHDCMVGDFSHVAPNATLGGAVHVGESVLIGAGANVLPGLRIGDGAVIGAGAVVTRSVEPGETLSGVPARKRL